VKNNFNKFLLVSYTKAVINSGDTGTFL
jgi:hypothetical protein